MTAFLAGLDGWDITYIALASWLILAALVAPCMGRAMRDADEIRQPDERDWYCSDGRWRTEAEAADWAAETDDSEAWDADALPEWINDSDVPDYVPQEWVA